MVASNSRFAIARALGHDLDPTPRRISGRGGGGGEWTELKYIVFGQFIWSV